jgi:hypothetical protein
MKLHLLSHSSKVILALSLSLSGALATVPNSPPTNTPPAQTSAPVPDSHQWDIPQSVFHIPAGPRDGRDPFFPNSALNAQPVKQRESVQVDMSGFVLNGITSPPRRSAMINGRTFEPGESGEVRMPNGAKALIKCVEIKTDSAVIEAGGQRLELKMRFGL